MLGVFVVWKLQSVTVKNNFVRGLFVTTGATTAGFGFNQEHAASADGYMVNVPIITAGQIVERAKAAVCRFA